MKVFVVMPAYNERGRIGAVVRGLLPRVDRVIVVDDGSTDGTADEARAAGADVVAHVLNRGQGAALKTGTLLAADEGADVIVHFDADGQHDPDALPALLAPFELGSADVVFGSRFLGLRSDGMPFSRRLLLGAARQFSSLVLGIPRSVTDPQSGVRAMSAEAARGIDFTQDRMAHCSEILRLVSRSGLRSVEVPVRVIYTAETLAKGQKAADAVRIVWQLLLGAFQR
ncbi:MAG TPA: glycosyltransferase family 2 protein [Candidatus Binatia bacterium]|jgi:glycosyltransferase involved in cell wall biosynthesis|nr:glycosyltransferase family 2 protein [Candidatus Binatia bacterium]